jgi:two-component system, OmpR family, sensor histidine kinase MtrB
VTPARPIRPGRLRRRLTIAFALVAALSAAALAAGSYLVVRENRLDDSLSRAVEQSRFNLELADEVLRAADDPQAGVTELLPALERRGEFTTIGRGDGVPPFSTSLSFGVRQLPEELVQEVRSGRLAYQRTEASGERFLAVGGRVRGVELYFLYSEAELFDQLGQLRTILLIGLGALALVAALVGALVARRTLAPVAQASAAAQSLAEGILDTRLPAGGRDEFGAWAASFNEMAEALEAKIQALSEAEARERRFTADVAHELRTPLTALVAEAGLLAEQLDLLPADARRPAELLVADVARLRRLVEDLMEVSRLDSGAEAVRLEPLELRSLVEAIARDRGLVEVAGDEVPLESDRRRLERIVGNLVSNALEHGGGARVRVGREGSSALVEVADRGPGIPAEHLPHLFDRFYKADPARSGSGSGLGLAIARENARLLGGDIEVESRPGATRFTLRLPVTESLPGGDSTVSQGEQHEARNPVGGKP